MVVRIVSLGTWNDANWNGRYVPTGPIGAVPIAKVLIRMVPIEQPEQSQAER